MQLHRATHNLLLSPAPRVFRAHRHALSGRRKAISTGEIRPHQTSPLNLAPNSRWLHYQTVNARLAAVKRAPRAYFAAQISPPFRDTAEIANPYGLKRECLHLHTKPLTFLVWRSRSPHLHTSVGGSRTSFRSCAGV